MVKIKKFNTFNEDLTDAGIPKEFMDKAKEGKPSPDDEDFIKSSMETGKLLFDIINKENQYTKDELKSFAIKTVKTLFSKSSVINMDDINFNLTISDMPDPRNPRNTGNMKGKTRAGYNDEDFTTKKNEEPEEIRPDIDKRRIVNALTQGFALASQKDVIMSDDNSLPAEIFQDYFKLMNLSTKTHWTIPEEFLKNPQFTHDMGGVALGKNEIEYDEETKKYTVSAKGVILIILVHEMVMGVYEIIALHSQAGKTAEELERIYKLTDTMSMESEGLRYGTEMVTHIREFYDNLEDKLIKEGKITKKQDILASLLATFYRYPARDFVSLCERLFSLDDSKKPYQEFGDIYMDIIEALDGNKSKEVVNPKAKATYNMDELLDKISSDGYKSLSPEEKEFLKNQQ